MSPGGVETMTLSEFKSLTGYNEIDDLLPDECLMLTDNAGPSYASKIGGVLVTPSGRIFTIRDAFSGYADTYGISAKMIVSDETPASVYTSVIRAADSFDVWCADKAAFLSHLDTPLPEDLKGKPDISVIDAYSTTMEEYSGQVRAKLDARTIVTAALLYLSVVMLYLMQRARLRERMDLVAVYRLLGIPKRSLVTVFALESLFSTLKFAVPTVLIACLTVQLTSRVEGLDTGMIFPLWAAGVTLLAITVVRLIISTLPVLCLLRQPPARLAAKYNF